MPLIGYARVSTDDQTLLPQAQALKAAGCSVIRERTKAGLASARLEGRIGGNPGLRARNPEALRKVRLARHDGYMERVAQTAADWVALSEKERQRSAPPGRFDEARYKYIALGNDRPDRKLSHSYCIAIQ